MSAAPVIVHFDSHVTCYDGPKVNGQCTKNITLYSMAFDSGMLGHIYLMDSGISATNTSLKYMICSAVNNDSHHYWLKLSSRQYLKINSAI